MKKLFLATFIIFFSNCKVPNINKVVIWGHKLHTNTFSYINYALDKAFRYLKYDTYWLDNDSDLNGFDFNNTLFITEEQVDQKIPLMPNCIYILHNCDSKKYLPIEKDSLVIKLQVFTIDCLERDVVKLDDFIYAELKNRVLYMPWATDLLPYEIDSIKKQVSENWVLREKGKDISFVGTHDGFFVVEPYLMKFNQVSKQHGFDLKFYSPTTVGVNDAVDIISKSSLAPALQGAWQCEKGYIPCRIFKNISYGKWGVTNNQYVYELFNKKITYNQDPEALLLESYNKICNLKLEEQVELMDFVRDNHTYISRIKTIFKFIELLDNCIE